MAVLLVTFSIIPAMAAVPAPAAASDADADDEENFLLDYGNGKITWFSGNISSSAQSAAEKILEDNGIEVTTSGDLTIDGVAPKPVGGDSTGGSLSESGTTGVTFYVSWHYFRWDAEGSVWKEVL